MAGSSIWPGPRGQEVGGEVVVGVPGQEERLFRRQLPPLAHLAGQELEQALGLDGGGLGANTLPVEDGTAHARHLPPPAYYDA